MKPIKKRVGLVKTFLLCPLLGMNILANAQLQDYYGAWVSARDDMFLIYDTTYSFHSESITDMHDLIWKMNVDINGDTLRFWKKIDVRPPMIHKYDFRVLKKNEKSMELYPISSLSVNSFGSKKIAFTKQPLIEEPFHFEKLVFIDSCIGRFNPCAYSLIQITNDKKIQLAMRNQDGGQDLDEMSYFEGQLPDSTYQKLIYILGNAAFKRYQYDEKYSPFGHMNSRSIKHYQLSYNDKKLSFSTPRLPPTLSELHWLFYLLSYEYEFEEVEPFGFEVD